MADGTIIIETGLDNSGIEKGIKQTKQSLKAQAASLAAEYKKQGMSSSDAFKKAWNEIERSSEVSADAVVNNWTGAADKIKSIIGTAAKATGVAAVTGLAAATKAGMDFEAQMSRVRSISGANNEEFARLNEQAKQLGADTAFSALEAAEGMENLASAGFDVEETIAAMPGMLDLAASSGEDLASSADIAASTLRGFKMDASHEVCGAGSECHGY